MSALCAAQTQTSASPRSFTVTDSIAWTHVVNFDRDYSANPNAGTPLFSPDGARFLLHTTHGEVRENVLVDSLLLFRTAEVEAYLSSPTRTTPPQADVLVSRRITRESGMLANVQWLDPRAVAFIAEGDNGTNQVFVADAHAGTTRQLTDSSTPVSAFAVAADRILYYAHTPLASRPTVEPADNKHIGQLIFEPDPDSSPLRLYQTRRARSAALPAQGLPVDLPPATLFRPFQRIWPSPSGRYAVTFVPATNAPPHWAQYRIPDYERFGYTRERAVSDPTSRDVLFRTRYALVDTETGQARPLLDAPSGWLSANRTPLEVFWQDDEQSVVVSNTYLPLQGVDARSRAQRESQPAIAEIDIHSDRATPLVFEPVLSRSDEEAGRRYPYRISSVEWDSRGRQLIVTERRRDSKTQRLSFVTVVLEKRRGAWRATSVAPRSAEAPSFDIHLTQSLNEPPKVYALRGNTRKVLFDPNPQAMQFSFGRVEAITWSDDTYKIQWKGGLVYPVGYQVSERYPLIVQSHGFDPEQFLLDGPISPTGGSTAMAAQAFANAGFVVLQVEDNREAWTGNEEEGHRFAAGIRVAIERLVTQGLVDAQRVGFIGFSRTGFHALYLLADYPSLVRAVNISDSVQAGYLQTYVLAVNAGQDTGFELARMVGGAPQLDDMSEFFNRHPLYKLGHTQAAVRIEAIGQGGVLAMWETYASLRRHGCAVDLLSFPYGSHVQFRPAERLGSQGGNVDWFRFWLQSYEDPVAEKAEQYERWRKLRDDQPIDSK